MKSRLMTSRELARTLAKAANIQPEPEAPSLEDKIARIKENQARLQGKSPVRVRRIGESNLLAKPKGLIVGSIAHRLVAQNYYYRSITSPRWEQVILLETLFRE